MKTLILYTSKTGNTKVYAEDIAKKVQADVFPLKGFRAKKMVNYDTIVFGGWVQAGTIKGLDKFLSNYDAIKAKNVIVFSVGMRDVYGRLPEEVTLLIQKKRIDLYTSQPEFTSVEEYDTYVDILMSDSFSRINGIGNELFNAMVPFLNILKVTFLEKQLRLRISKGKDWLNDLEKIVRNIDALYSKRNTGTVC